MPTHVIINGVAHHTSLRAIAPFGNLVLTSGGNQVFLKLLKFTGEVPQDWFSGIYFIRTLDKDLVKSWFIKEKQYIEIPIDLVQELNILKEGNRIIGKRVSKTDELYGVIDQWHISIVIEEGVGIGRNVNELLRSLARLSIAEESPLLLTAGSD